MELFRGGAGGSGGSGSSDIGQQSGTQNNTIAIAMSFDYPDPGQAQAVLQSFVSKFLTMDSQDVEDQATLTVRFLQRKLLNRPRSPGYAIK